MFDKSVRCSLGSFVILNSEGWIATAAHMLNSFPTFDQHKLEIEAYKQSILLIEQNNKLTEKQKQKKKKGIKVNPEWITSHSLWWGHDGWNITDIRVLPQADLAIGRIIPFNPGDVLEYPTLKDPEKDLIPGTSLCKLGFPFHQPESTFDESTGAFILAPGVVPVPRFPIEGIYTRDLEAGFSPDGKYKIMFLETSSPGLRGQSGGPIFDTRGTLWAIQIQTNHLDLGFNPRIQRNGKSIEEYQFLNVGIGVHPQTLIAFLKDNGISFKLSSY
jgi:hypothetical protein